MNEPIRNLVAAVITQAIEDLAHPAGKTAKRDANHAFWWIFVDKETPPMSLAWCCDQLEWCTPRDVRLYAERLAKERVWKYAQTYGKWVARGD